MTRPVNLYIWPVQGWCVFGKKEGEKRGKALSPIFTTEAEAQRFAEKLIAEDSGGREVTVMRMRIENAEHTSFIEGLLFYIAMRLGDKDSLMGFLRAWNKEYEKAELDDLGGRDDER